MPFVLLSGRSCFSRNSSRLFSADILRARTASISASKAQSWSMDICSRSLGVMFGIPKQTIPSRRFNGGRAGQPIKMRRSVLSAPLSLIWAFSAVFNNARCRGFLFVRSRVSEKFQN